MLQTIYHQSVLLVVIICQNISSYLQKKYKNNNPDNSKTIFRIFILG